MRLSAGNGDIPSDLEDLWHVRRSLARRNRSKSTVKVYCKSFDAFWRWAIDQGITDPADVDYRVINQWTDHLLTAPSIRNGRPILDSGTGEPRTIDPSHPLRQPPPVLHLVLQGVRAAAPLPPCRRSRR